MAKKSLLSKFFSKQPIPQQDPEKEQRKIPELKMIFFIVDWNQYKVISNLLDEEKVRLHFVSKGKGTASSEILDLLGIGASEKAVVICLEQTVLAPVLLKEARKKLGFHRAGAGIAFTIPLSGINSPILQVFKQSIHKNEKIVGEPKNAGPAVEGGNMADQFTHDLIISIVNQGYSDEFMNTAREAGASGGTVLNARGQAHEGTVKFFGVSIQDEKEIIIILASREKKIPIMRAVCDAHGLNSKAQGIVFSLPVDKVLGLSAE
ncbi:MAG: hypothetical protein FWG27_00730 [Treponema sp.]|nr:hypothetical protein [Treponema sp.]